MSSPKVSLTTLPCGHRVMDPRETHYCSYLKVSELRALQPAPEQLRHPDELLFIITHQSFELWFKEILFELERSRELMESGDARGAARLVRRVARIVTWFPQQQGILESMPAVSFFQFREKLVPASGLESEQFREIEILSGLREAEYRHFLSQPVGPAPEEPKTAIWSERLAQRWEEPSLREAFLRLLERRGTRLVELYRREDDPGQDLDLLGLAEALADYDQAFATWRFTHARLAERFLGATVEGTGYTTGVRYLDAVARMRQHFFPEIWEARSELWRVVQREKDSPPPASSPSR